MRNSIKIWSILIVGSLLLMILGHQLADRRGLLWGFVMALGINFFVFFYGHVRLLQLFPRLEVEGQDPWGLREIVRRFALKAKMAPPRVYVVDLPTPISFSLGRSWAESSLVVSEALLETLSHDEIQVVLAYEMARLKRHGAMSLGMASALARVIMWPAETLDYLLNFSPRAARALGWLQRGLDFTLSAIAHLFISLAVSRADYFAADQLASQYLGSAQKMAEVLWKLDSYAQTKPLGTHPSVAHLFIVNPLTNRRWNRYFDRQPPIERRIEKLVGHFPI